MPALLDRERERAALDGLLGDLRLGRGGALVVRGEAGVGKSALLSVRTVEWHLAKVFTKLGISSRRQLQQALPDSAGAGPMA